MQIIWGGSYSDDEKEHGSYKKGLGNRVRGFYPKKGEENGTDT